MINLVFASIFKTIGGVQKSISLTIANWPISLIALGTGLTFEEIYYGFRIIKFLGII